MFPALIDKLNTYYNSLRPASAKDLSWALYAVGFHRTAYEKNAKRWLEMAESLVRVETSPGYAAFVWSGDEAIIAQVTTMIRNRSLPDMAIDQLFLLVHALCTEYGELENDVRRPLLRLVRGYHFKGLVEVLLRSAALRHLGDGQTPNFYFRDSLDDSIAAAWYVEKHSVASYNCHVIWEEVISRLHRNGHIAQMDSTIRALLYAGICKHLFTR